jgi:3-oxoacyl-[acyl-carrier-protein] synthase III
MNSRIEIIETYLPENILSNKMISEEFPKWYPEKIEEKLGVRERHVVSENETALDLATYAGKRILKKYSAAKIGFVILCTQSPDFFLPTSACILQSNLGLGNSVGALDFNLGCSGFIYGLAISKALIASNMSESILLVMSETYTKHINKLDFANRSIFGDAATAIIVEPCHEPHIHEFVFGTDGNGASNLIVKNGGLRNKFDPNAIVYSDESGNKRTNNNLYMNGPEIFNFTIESIPTVVQNVLNKNNTSLDEIDYFIFHQANKFMLDYLRKKIKIPKEKFYNNLLTTGNTVSSTIPIALKDSIDNGTIKSGDKVLLCGFGVGYSWGATIITI